MCARLRINECDPKSEIEQQTTHIVAFQSGLICATFISFTAPASCIIPLASMVFGRGLLQQERHVVCLRTGGLCPGMVVPEVPRNENVGII